MKVFIMNKEKPICLICGSDKVKRFAVENSDQLTLGPRFNFEEIYYKCNSCHEESDIFGETDKNYLKAQKKAEAALIKEIINHLGEIGISMAFFERVMELPIRTLTRWKTGDFSSAALALLRIVKTYPWIIDIADHRFDPLFAKKMIQQEALIENINTMDSGPKGKAPLVYTLYNTSETRVYQ
jgi:DNA-binding transcriptional regulator YiaG